MRLGKKTLSLVLCLIMAFGSIVLDIDSISNLFNTRISANNTEMICLADLECVDEGHYDGNEGDSRIYRLDGKEFDGYNPKGFEGNTSRNGNKGTNDFVYENGFEIWVARWNYDKEISWAFRTFRLDGKYVKLFGNTGIINSYNTENYDTTIYFYNGNDLLYSFDVLPQSSDHEFSFDVTGVEELKIMAKDNIAVCGGTSFALYDLFLDDNAGTETYETGDLIKYGSYPQSEVDDEYLLGDLNSLNLNWVSYEYYSGSGDSTDGKMHPSDYMRYSDVEYPEDSGNWYRAVTFDLYRWGYAGSEMSSEKGFYLGQNGCNYECGNVYWFKYEPLLWRVLDPDSGFLITEKLIDSQPFNNFILKEYVNGTTTFYGDSNKTYYSNNYVRSDIRKWLNNDFYNTAFNVSQKKNIKKSVLSNLGYNTLIGTSGYECYDYEMTQDYVFLLSYDEFINTKYGLVSDDNKVIFKGKEYTDYCRFQGLDKRVGPYWRLRSAGGASNRICEIIWNDSVSTSSSQINDMGHGIHPAIKLYNLRPDFDNNEPQYQVGESFLFGTYPQTRVADNDLIANLNSIANLSNWKSYNYYSGDGFNQFGTMKSSDYMRYIDVNYAGEKYRGVTFDTYRPSYTTSISSDTPDATNQQRGQYGNGYRCGNIYWFKFEPIKWRVLNSTTGLVVCEYLLDTQPYNNDIYYDEETKYYYGDSEFINYVGNYKYSSIRNWLNNDFCNTAFSASEQELIKESKYSFNSSFSGNYAEHDESDFVEDKVFMLSSNDVKNTNYGFSTLCASPTDYAKSQGALSFSNTISTEWMTRSGFNGRSYHIIEYSGLLNRGEPYGAHQPYTDFACNSVRPAIRLISVMENKKDSEVIKKDTIYNLSIDYVDNLKYFNNGIDTVEVGKPFKVCLNISDAESWNDRLSCVITNDKTKAKTVWELNNREIEVIQDNPGVWIQLKVPVIIDESGCYSIHFLSKYGGFDSINVNAVVLSTSSMINSLKTERYSFGNFSLPNENYPNVKFEIKDFERAYGPEISCILFLVCENFFNNGLCFAFSLSTDLMIHDKTAISSFGVNKQSDLSEYTDSVIYDLNVLDWLKMFTIYQLIAHYTNDGDVRQIYNEAVNREYLVPVLLESENKDARHLVLIVAKVDGLDDNVNFAIYDPNSPTQLKTLQIDSGLTTWCFNDDELNSLYSANSGGHISAVKKESIDFVLNNYSRFLSTNSPLSDIIYVCSSTRLDSNNNLDRITILDDVETNSSESLYKNSYWANANGNELKIDTEDKNNICVAGETVSITANCKERKEILFNVGNDESFINYDCDSDEEIDVTVNYHDNGSRYSFNVVGTSNGEECKIEKAGNKFIISGMNDVNVSLDKDGKLVDTITTKCDNAALTVLVDGIVLRSEESSSNSIANAKIIIPKNTEVEYAATVTVKAKATGVPEGYYVALYDGKTLLKKGSNTEVSYTFPGEFTGSKNITVKIIDDNENVQKDGDGKELTGTVEIKAKSGFFAKLIAFFKRLFKALPAVTVEPNNHKSHI